MELRSFKANENEFIIARKVGGTTEHWRTDFIKSSGAEVTSESTCLRPYYWCLERTADDQDGTVYWSFYVIDGHGEKLYVTSERNGKVYINPDPGSPSRSRLFEVLLRSGGAVYFRQRKFKKQSKFLTTNNRGQLRMVRKNRPGKKFQWFILKRWDDLENISLNPYLVEIHVHQESLKWITLNTGNSEIPVAQTSASHEWRVTAGDTWRFATSVFHAHQTNTGVIHLDEVEDSSREFPATQVSEKFRFQSPFASDRYLSHLSRFVDLSHLINATWWEAVQYRMTYRDEENHIKFFPPLKHERETLMH